MKKTVWMTFLILSFWLYCPAFCNSSYMSVDEYSKLFEMGFMGDECNQEEEYHFELKEKEKNEIEPDAIKLETENKIKLKVEKTEFLEPYKLIFNTPTSKVELLKTDKFSLYSDGTRELSDYMTNNFKTTMNISYTVNPTFTFMAGNEVWYVNPNASIGAKKIYFNPRINISKNLYLDYISKYNQTSKYIEQEVGLNYVPKAFKNNAVFGVKASGVMDDGHEMQSRKLKFTTDFYIY